MTGSNLITIKLLLNSLTIFNLLTIFDLIVKLMFMFFIVLKFPISLTV